MVQKKCPPSKSGTADRSWQLSSPIFLYAYIHNKSILLNICFINALKGRNGKKLIMIDDFKIYSKYWKHVLFSANDAIFLRETFLYWIARKKWMKRKKIKSIFVRSLKLLLRRDKDISSKGEKSQPKIFS